MKTWMHEMLRCPECLPDEAILDLDGAEQEGDDVINGRLTCPQCRRFYPIREGTAVLLPERSRSLLDNRSGYNSDGMLSAYLWSHYGELFNDPEATDAYRRWAACFGNSSEGGIALDIGCAVGRLAFELSGTHDRVIGIDTSLPFIAKARGLMKQKRLVFDLVVEGLITEDRSCDLHPNWRYDRVDFIVADALALPFPDGFFSTAASVNILEKVPYPLGHLLEVNRVLRDRDAMFLFSDPFSWDESVSPPERWLGGTVNGGGNGRGIDNMTGYFQGRDGVFDPPLKILDQGSVPWKIRKTENLWEYIISQYLIGVRANGRPGD